MGSPPEWTVRGPVAGSDSDGLNDDFFKESERNAKGSGGKSGELHRKGEGLGSTKGSPIVGTRGARGLRDRWWNTGRRKN